MLLGFREAILLEETIAQKEVRLVGEGRARMAAKQPLEERNRLLLLAEAYVRHAEEVERFRRVRRVPVDGEGADDGEDALPERPRLLVGKRVRLLHVVASELEADPRAAFGSGRAEENFQLAPFLRQKDGARGIEFRVGDALALEPAFPLDDEA